MKIRPLGAELFHADGTEGHVEVTNPIAPFLNFVNAPKSFYDLIGRDFCDMLKLSGPNLLIDRRV
jgi:hypothetical protein